MAENERLRLLCKMIRGNHNNVVLDEMPHFEPKRAVPSHVNLYLVGASWCGACKPAHKLLTEAGWPVKYIALEDAGHLRVPPALPQLIIENLHAERIAIGPDVRAMKSTLASLFG